MNDHNFSKKRTIRSFYQSDGAVSALRLFSSIIYTSQKRFNQLLKNLSGKYRHMKRAIRSFYQSNGSLPVNLEFHLGYPLSRLFSGIGSSFLVRCSRTFSCYPNLIFPLDLSSAPETFVCLFLVSDFILQHLLLFVNSFLKIYFYFFLYS